MVILAIARSRSMAAKWKIKRADSRGLWLLSRKKKMNRLC